MIAQPSQFNQDLLTPVIDRTGADSSFQPVNQLIPDITDRLIKAFNPESIFLFGSHVWGTPNADSDLDILVIVTHSEVSSSKRSALAYRALRDIPYPLDILVRTRQEIEKFSQTPSALECQILMSGKCLYGQ
jgi:uncharacterized protein